MEDALRGRDVAAVIMETIPATYGFPLPAPGYLEGTKTLCERTGALYIADEVQTGLMRTGELWRSPSTVSPRTSWSPARAYPAGCTRSVLSWSARRRRAGSARTGSRTCPRSAGAELGCIAALKTLEITCRPEVRSMVFYIADLIGRGLRQIQQAYPDWFTGIRQDGLVMGLEFRPPPGRQVRDEAALRARRVGHLLHPRSARPAVQAGPAAHPDLCAELLDRVEVAIAAARSDAASGRRVR